MKEIKDDANKWKDKPLILGLQESIFLNGHTTHSNLQIQRNPYQVTNDIFHRTGTKIFKFA